MPKLLRSQVARLIHPVFCGAGIRPPRCRERGTKYGIYQRPRSPARGINLRDNSRTQT
jgi:hypothetical protein